MQYVLLIHAADSRYASLSPEAAEALMQEYGAYSKELFATGKAGDCAALELSHTATTVRVREGKRAVKDGPFAETREQLGGYFTFTGSEEDAIAWGAKIPDAKGGTIEVRPILEMPMPEAKTEAPKLDPKAHKEYLLLIYDNEQVWAEMSEAARGAMFGRYMQYSQEIRASGNYLAGAPLDSVKEAKSVHVEGAKRVVRDGPFAETREQLGGYYRVLAKNLDEAIALAARIPSVEIGSIEVRPVMDTSAYE